MTISLKYAVVERERRFLVAEVPEGVTAVRDIVDHYLDGTRLRLREVTEADGTVTRKLTHKVRLDGTAAEVACTNAYLDADEWAVMTTLPARTLRKQRSIVERDGWRVAVDRHEDGTLVAEIDDGEPGGTAHATTGLPPWLDVLADVTLDEGWTGAGVARRQHQEG